MFVLSSFRDPVNEDAGTLRDQAQDAVRNP